jgi:hypothetical protein
MASGFEIIQTKNNYYLLRMISKGQRQQGQPVITKNGAISRLQRVPFQEKSFSEQWIQDMLFQNPLLLPIDEIDPSFSPLIPLGREISTPAGSIDNLFITPEGNITIVETKLWRNPEARREVVGQILDYAKELNKWTFTELNEAIKVNSKIGNNLGIIDIIRSHESIDEGDEQYLIDSISKNLKRGRFLLLIVGDGIRESVEDMVEYLNQTPQLFFTLALVELQVFRFSESESKDYLIIPQVVTRTKEIVRAIFRVEGAESESLKINIETDLLSNDDNQGKQSSKRFRISTDDYFEQLEQYTDKTSVNFVEKVIKECEEHGYYISWGQGSIVIKLNDPDGSGIKITLFVIDKRGTVYLGWSAGQLERLGLKKELAYQFASNTAKLLPKMTTHPKFPHSWMKPASLNDFIKIYPSFMECVDAFVNSISEALENQNV